MKSRTQEPATPVADVELSVVMPCLNEADTLATCIQKAWTALESLPVRSEVIVADNGSTDGSREIAVANRARLIDVTTPGYGSALMGGIDAARGRFVIMGDADDSYDFGEVPALYGELAKGAELVQGCRLPSGGGRILPGAMPFTHRWIGNPLFSFLARRWFKAPIHDVYCGLRGFTKDLYQRLDQRCLGMEFATEMIVRSSLGGARIAEVPITLHPDGRKAHAPHLRTFRDGWRTLRFFLLYSPRWLYLVPGAVLIALGALGYTIALPGVRIDFRGMVVHFDAHTLLFASLFVICGWQAVLFAVFAKTFAISEGLLPEDPMLSRFFERLDLERSLVVSGAVLILGVALLLAAVWQWKAAGFGPLDYARTMRLVVPGSTFTVLGFQTILGSFFVSILGMRRL